MKISELFEQKRPVISMELFPPKLTSSIENMYVALTKIATLKPDYISITYGAGGTVTTNRTLELAKIIKNQYNIEPLPHLTAIHSTKEGVREYLIDLKKSGLENVLALRGDRRADIIPSEEFTYASDLIDYIKEVDSNVNIVGACYPEGHFEAESFDQDLDNLKIKVDAGVTHLNTQLFFDNKDFYKFINLARRKGVTLPIQAGIMPITSKKQIERTLSLSGVKIPTKLAKLVAKYGDNDDKMREMGIKYAIEQINDLIERGVDGIHLYIMNNADTAERLMKAIKAN